MLVNFLPLKREGFFERGEAYLTGVLERGFTVLCKIITIIIIIFIIIIIVIIIIIINGLHK